MTTRSDDYSMLLLVMMLLFGGKQTAMYDNTYYDVQTTKKAGSRTTRINRQVGI